MNIAEFYRGGSSAQIEAQCLKVITAQMSGTGQYRVHVHETVEFMKALWLKYDCESVANIYEGLIGFEEAMYGLERDRLNNKRYRDHFVHMFNCFTFGLRILSQISTEFGSDTQSLLKVPTESLKELGLPFDKDYSFQERLGYMWMLMATFHDIAVPFQHLSKLAGGMERYVSLFGLRFTAPGYTSGSFDSSRLSAYLSHIASLYSGKFDLHESDKHKYAAGEDQSVYMQRRLGLEFDKGNHGVLSGFFLYKTIEEIFLLGKTSKFKLTASQFGTYSKYVLEQDVSRAALACSLHNLEPSEFNNSGIFPLRFSDYPLSFLLILADEMQEYLRWEGGSIIGDMKFDYHPIISVTRGDDGVELHCTFAFSESQEEYFIDQAKKIAKIERSTYNGETLDDAIIFIVQGIRRRLESKLYLGEDFKVSISVSAGWQRTVFTTHPHNAAKA